MKYASYIVTNGCLYTLCEYSWYSNTTPW